MQGSDMDNEAKDVPVSGETGMQFPNGCTDEECSIEVVETNPGAVGPVKVSVFQDWMASFALGRFLLKLFHFRMVRFFAVAGLNTAFGYAVFSLFIFCGIHYTLAALLGQVIGVLFNFRTYGVLVFKNKNVNLLPRFIAVYVITYFCNIGGMTLVKNLYGWNDYIASAVMCVPIGLLGYVLNKILVFEPIIHRNRRS